MSAEPAWLRAKERIPTTVFEDSDDISRAVAGQIADLITQRQAEGRRCVLGLATGSTPRRVYRLLVEMYRSGALSFAHVTTFNLDEYWPMQPQALQSYRRFMQEHLFDHVDIDPACAHVPDGSLPLDQVQAHCEQYERLIQEAGGIDLQLLGLGRGGHIGFNECGSLQDTPTRLVTLDRITRVDAASDFFDRDHVPRQAISMGIRTILAARKVLLMAFGEGKAAAAAAAVEGPLGTHCPASFLQNHQNAAALLDAGAAAELTRCKCPWMLGPVEWSRDGRVVQAAAWLSGVVRRPLLCLTGDDYAQHSLQGLVEEVGGGQAEAVNLLVFNRLRAKVTGWPAGKPPQSAASAHSSDGGLADAPAGPGAAPPCVNASSSCSTGAGRVLQSGSSPSQQAAWPKRILVLSPHPDDDVISMGGTLIRLAAQGHEVHVGYQTSGCIAVRDADLAARVYFAEGFVSAVGATPAAVHQDKGAQTTCNGLCPAHHSANPSSDKDAAPKRGSSVPADSAPEAAAAARIIRKLLADKLPGEPDPPPVQHAKTLVRQCEARAAAAAAGVPSHRLHFLNSPFYRTGTVVKADLGPADVALVQDLMDLVQPHQIYAAGDLSDPHGTHRVCLQAVFQALEGVRGRPWFSACQTQVLLYRGAWQEWGVHEADLCVPLSPLELRQKLQAIWAHQSQKDPPLFPGADEREFWQRAEERNRATAARLAALGLPCYEAAEAFVRHDPAAAAQQGWGGEAAAMLQVARPGM